jgi:hypothetical protein
MNASRNRPAGSLCSVTFTAGRVIRDVNDRCYELLAEERLENRAPSYDYDFWILLNGAAILGFTALFLVYCFKSSVPWRMIA